METKEKTLKNTHHGHAIKRIRHTLGIKQEVLAADLGISQTQISAYEQKKVIDNDMIGKFAKALNVAPGFIKELKEDPVTVIIENNTFEKGSSNIGKVDGDHIINNNPIDEILELCREKQALYERIAELEKGKNDLLGKLLKNMK